VLVTEWSKLGPPSKVKLLNNDGDKLVVCSPEKAGRRGSNSPWPPLTFCFQFTIGARFNRVFDKPGIAY